MVSLVEQIWCQQNFWVRKRAVWLSFTSSFKEQLWKLQGNIYTHCIHCCNKPAFIFRPGIPFGNFTHTLIFIAHENIYISFLVGKITHVAISIYFSNLAIFSVTSCYYSVVIVIMTFLSFISYALLNCRISRSAFLLPCNISSSEMPHPAAWWRQGHRRSITQVWPAAGLNTYSQHTYAHMCVQCGHVCPHVCICIHMYARMHAYV